MNEICCQFGEGNHLAGISTEPEGRAPRDELLLINAGLPPKFGPFRPYAKLARRLARDGRRTLRFDLGGIGDRQQLERDAARSHPGRDPRRHRSPAHAGSARPAGGGRTLLRRRGCVPAR